MTVEHRQWISAWLSTNNPYGRCAKAVQEMHAAFPDLTIVKGHAETDWGRRAHWWLATATGEVVDPTARQFGAVFGYDPWKPGDEAQVGTCMNCGDEIWKPIYTLDEEPKSECICSERCHTAFTTHLNNSK